MNLMSKPLHIIILAAGDGTRMKSGIPKVLHTVGGRPMLAHVYETAIPLGAAAIHVIYNPDTEEVCDALAGAEITWVPQNERLGTGHAVMQAMPDIPDNTQVLVLYGDLPLLTEQLLHQLLDTPPADLKILTMTLEQPAGYGRIERNQQNNITGIIEEKDASGAQKAIQEVNTGIVLADSGKLKKWLASLKTENSQREYYLTDIFAAAHAEGTSIVSVEAEDSRELLGANDRIQLSELESHYRQRRANELMLKGVQIADPTRIDIRGKVSSGSDVSIDINVVLEGDVSLGDGVSIGVGCVIRDCSLAAGTRVHPYTVMEGVRTHGACDIGPFARVRPGTELGKDSRVGNFVEVKNSSLGQGTKASHLSYLGDSIIGSNVNIGAGTITCNYDGVNKHQTIIEDDVFIGSDTQLVAPVRIGRGADIGAGSTITKDAPEGKLSLSRSKQLSVPGWKRPEKPEKQDKN
jgi:bifunctional UDP-N-acetylglucosamine pyrophosphorylase/glucosamine-1-phosphate N-acetyltransferase